MRLPLPVRSYRTIATETAVNCMVETKPADAKGSYALIRAPGITLLASTNQPGRGLALFAGKLWAVVGEQLIVVDTLGSGVLESSTAVIGTGRVSMAATVDRLCVVASGQAWLATPDNVLSEISDTDFRTPSAVDFIDQYLVFTESESPRWFASNLNAPESYDSTYFATAEFQPDNLLGLIADHGQVLLAGERTMELWQNDGSAGFPFSLIASGALEIGCGAGQSLAKLDNSILWLANDGTVRRLAGFTPVRVSTHGIERIIQSWGDVSDCYGLAYSFGGHLVYVLTKKGFGTVAYDVTTGEWHERKSFGYPYWRVVAVAQYAEQVYCLDEDGRVGIMSETVYTEFGDRQVVEFSTAPIYAEGERVVVDQVELVARTQ